VGTLRSDWLVPQWPAPPGVRAVCSTRAGGVSRAPYDQLNLGDHVGDDPADVARNRTVFSQAIGVTPVFLNQVHGSDVLQLDASTTHGRVADACMTLQRGVACTIMVADCLPVLFTTRTGQCVAAAHAGWRGLALTDGVGVLAHTLRDFCALSQVDTTSVASEIIAWLGPCIGPQAFEVGDEVRDAFVQNDPHACKFFVARTHGKWFANLSGLARLQLNALGICNIYGNDGSTAWCTVGQASRFFSHRRDGVSGRFAVAIWRDL